MLPQRSREPRPYIQLPGPVVFHRKTPRHHHWKNTMPYRPLIPCLLSATLAAGCATEAGTKSAKVTHPPAAKAPSAAQATPVPKRPPAAEAPPAANPSRVVYTKDVATPAEIRNVQAAVRRHLRDPEGARFGQVFAINGSNGTRYYCGFVNKKDNFGNDIEYAMFHLNRKDYLIMSDDLLWRLSIPDMCEPHVEAGEPVAAWLTNVMGK